MTLIDLYNRAIARLGGEQLPLGVTPIEGDITGQLCANLFPGVLDLALSRHEWSFALKRMLLTKAGAADAVTGFAVRYAPLPTDMVRTVSLGRRLNEGPEYALEGDSLLTDLEGATLLYVSRVSDPEKWPADFADALAWGLAGELATARVNDPGKMQFCGNMFIETLSRAAAADVKKNGPKHPQGTWGTSRFANRASFSAIRR